MQPFTTEERIKINEAQVLIHRAGLLVENVLINSNKTRFIGVLNGLTFKLMKIQNSPESYKIQIRVTSLDND